VTISLVTRFEEDGNDSKLLFQIKNDNSKNVTITDINFVSGKNYDFIIAMKDILRQSNNEIPMTIQRHDHYHDWIYLRSLMESMFDKNETMGNKFFFWLFCRKIYLSVTTHAGPLPTKKINKQASRWLWRNYKDNPRTTAYN